ncbi:hypothetical protein [Microcoleus sp. BROC3]|uniref:hypothetical protein n=1 Tax=Microcoleus sp. BROC3 TaxID=3055323 RepID=UPI002FD0CA07
MTERTQLVNMRLTGTLLEIDATLTTLTNWGWQWAQGQKYKPREEYGQYDYLLEAVSAPNPISNTPAEGQQ